ncbi:MAG: hypothetical protein HZB62_11995 [Nitrospirae bacterium]|nr:hypothetical protein [Nitrospirota bacterium]
MKRKVIGLTIWIFILLMTAAWAQSPQVTSGLGYLSATQNADGSWGDAAYDEVLPSTVAVIETLRALKQQNPAAIAWLQAQELETTDYISERIYALSIAGTDKDLLISYLDIESYAWSGMGGPDVDNLDTLLALLALNRINFADHGIISGVLNSLVSTQKIDGGWGFNGEMDSRVDMTALVLQALSKFKTTYNLTVPISNGVAYILAHQYADGGYGTLSSTVYETSLAIIALIISGVSDQQSAISSQAAINYLSATQLANGSWNDDPYSTALALRALASVKPNLSISSTDITFSSPAPKTGDAITITANIKNTGPAQAPSTGSGQAGITVQFYDGDPLAGGILIGEAIIASIPAFSSSPASITWTIPSAAASTIFVSIDPLNAIDELSEADNIASKNLTSATLPDLSITSADCLIFPAAPDSYMMIGTFCSVRNLGETDASNVAVDFYMEASGQSPVKLKGSGIVPLVPAGGSVATVGVIADYQATGGQKTIRVVVDPQNTITESNKANNTAIKTFVIGAEIDVYINSSDISFSPANPKDGDTVTITSIIRNATLGNARNVVVRHYLGDPASGGTRIGNDISIPLIGTRGSETVTMQWNTTGHTGKNYIYVVADPDDVIAEYNNWNNTAGKTLKVASTQGPDLTLNSSDITYTPQNPNQGDMLTVTATIRNTGNQAALSVPVEFSIFNQMLNPPMIIGTATIASIPAGGTVPVQIPWDTTGMGGTYDLRVTIDRDDTIIELDETNNSASKPVVVTAPQGPDLVTSSIDLTGVTSDKQTRIISGNALVTIKNIGNQPANGPFSIIAFEDSNNNQVYDPGTDIIFGTATYQSGLAAGASNTVTIPISGTVLFIDSPLYVFVDSGKVITELDETNNINCLAVFTACRNSKVDAAVKSGASWLINHQVNVDTQGTQKAWGGVDIYYNALAIRAYKSMNKTVGTKYASVLNKLIQMQAPDGSWDINLQTTATAVMALIRSGSTPNDTYIKNAVAWLKRNQAANGSFGGTAYYTGIILTALLKAGEDKNATYIQKAVQWLIDTQLPAGYWGSVPGDTWNDVNTIPYPVIGLSLALSPTHPNVVKAKNWYDMTTYNHPYEQYRSFWLIMMIEVAPTDYRINGIVDGLLNNQMTDGGWKAIAGMSFSEFRTTADILDAMGKLGKTGTKIDNGVRWLDNHFNAAFEGFPASGYTWTTDYALVALQAAAIGDTANLNAIAKGRFAVLSAQSSNGSWSGYLPPAIDNLNIGTAGDSLRMFYFHYTNPSLNEQNAANNARTFLYSAQKTDNGWPATNYTVVNTDLYSSIIALRGLLQSGVPASHTNVSRGLSYLNSKQTSDGGFGSVGYTSIAAEIYKLAGSAYQGRLNQAVSWLKSRQQADGGWGLNTSGAAYALVGLSVAGEQGIEVAKGVSWLLAAQNADGGWSSAMGVPMSYDYNTAYAVTALSLARFNLAFNIDLSTERQSYCPGDTVRISAIPDAPAEEVTVTGALKLQEGTTVQLGFSLTDNTFNAEYVLPSTALPGTATIQTTGQSTYGYSIATTSFVVKNCTALKPDLSIGTASLQEAADPLAPNTRTVTATVRNLGIIDAHNVAVSFYQDAVQPENLIGSSSISSIGAFSGTATASTTVTIAGDTVIHVVIDPANLIDELNEANNNASLSLALVLPDLSITAADLTSAAPDPLNMDIRTVAATVKNLGGLGADNVTIKFYKDAFVPENLIKTLIIPNIGALTGTATVNTSITLTGDTVVYVVADPSNAIAETDETNNMASIALTRMIPDLSVSSSDIAIIPPAVTEGQSAVIAAIIHNTGNMGASDVVVSFYDGDPSSGGTLIGSVTKSWIDAGSTAYAETAWNTFGQSGMNYIHVVVDPLNVIHEGNETNNSSFIPVDVTPPVKPDLAITGTDITFTSLNPEEGAPLTLTATIRNLGIDAANVGVALYDGDPAAGGRLIDMKTIYQFIPFGGAVVIAFDIPTIGMAGNHKYYISLDPEHMIDEISETNNTAWSSITVGASSLGLSITTDKASYTANEDISVSLNIANQKVVVRSGTIEVKLLDSAGTVVSEATVTQALTLGPSETQALSFILNTGSILAGDYRVFSQFIEAGNAVSKIDAPITVAADREVSSAVTTDKIAYFPNQQAVITTSITSLSQNYIFENMTAKIAISDQQSAFSLHTETQTIPILLPGQVTELKTYWNTATNPPGAYPITLELRDVSGALVSTAAATLTISSEIKPSKLLRGQISVDRQSILQGEPLNISYQVTNVGNIDISQVDLSIKTVHVVNLSVYDTLTDQTGLQMGAAYANAQQLGTGTYSAKDYLVILAASINSIEETLASTYFRVEGAPSAPSLNIPAHSSDVETLTPVLSVNNATDPNDDRLTYEFQIYADAGLTTLVAESTLQQEGTSITSWQLPITLQENSLYFWRARAFDSRLYGQWMTPAAFRVNVTNEPPAAPTLSAPANNAFVDTSLPILTVNNASDPDSDNLTYNFMVALDPDFVNIVDQQIGIFSGSGSTSWQVTISLQENRWYYWKAQADDWLITGPWMATASFFVNTANEAPTVPMIIDPPDNSETVSRDLIITISNSTDPDSAVITYLFEVDTALTFDSPERIISGYVPQGQNSTSWLASGLKDNTYYYARVKASDGSAESSLSAVVGFFVNTANDAPTAPVLSNPSIGSGVNSFNPLLSVHNATDMDGDILTYEFEVYTDTAMTSLVSSASGLQETPQITGWTVSTSLTENSTYFWRARAFDGELYSPWMDLSSFTVNTANDAPTAPSLYEPVQGSSLSTLTPTLSINNATDPDSDSLTYDFEIYTGTTPVSSMTAIPRSASGITSVTLSALSDNTTYTWRARAYDGDRYGAWMDMATFSIHLPSTNITATIDFDPNTLNQKSQGNWVTVYIELPAGYNVDDIDMSSLRLGGSIPAVTWPYALGDYDHDGIPDLMVKFDRNAVITLLPNGTHVPVHVTGRVGATTFEGVDYIRVIH